MSNALRFADAVFAWTAMEILTPEWNAAFKKLWADFPLEMMVARHKHGMKPADHFDAAVARLQNEKEARAKFNCGTQECNGEIMCDDHYRQYTGLYD